MDADQAELEECRQRQDDEIIALESIFSDADNRESSQVDGHPNQPSVKLVQREPHPILDFYLPVTLPEPTRIAVHTYVPHNGESPAAGSSALPAPSSSLLPEADDNQKAPSETPKRRNKNGHLNATASTFQPRQKARSNATHKQSDASQMLERLSLNPVTTQSASQAPPPRLRSRRCRLCRRRSGARSS